MCYDKHYLIADDNYEIDMMAFSSSDDFENICSSLLIIKSGI